MLSADLSLLHNNLLELGLRERAAELLVGAVRHHCAACFGALQARITAATAVLRVRLGDAGAGGGARASRQPWPSCACTHTCKHCITPPPYPLPHYRPAPP